MSVRAILFLLIVTITLARPLFRERLPNKDAHTRPGSGIVCDSLGHINCGSGRYFVNRFGWDFAAAKHRWTKSFCEKDSDGDGVSNGAELGDPCCVFVVGGTPPQRNYDLSHPGESDSVPVNPENRVCSKSVSKPTPPPKMIITPEASMIYSTPSISFPLRMKSATPTIKNSFSTGQNSALATPTRTPSSTYDTTPTRTKLSSSSPTVSAKQSIVTTTELPSKTTFKQSVTPLSFPLQTLAAPTSMRSVSPGQKSTLAIPTRTPSRTYTATPTRTRTPSQNFTPTSEYSNIASTMAPSKVAFKKTSKSTTKASISNSVSGTPSSTAVPIQFEEPTKSSTPNEDVGRCTVSDLGNGKSCRVSATFSVTPTKTPRPIASKSPIVDASFTFGPFGVPTEVSLTTEKKRVCFPGISKVTLINGDQLPMYKLRVGNIVSVGRGKFSDVYMFTHEDRNTRHEFVVLQTSSNKTVTLSAGHYIYVNGKLGPAGEVRIGDKLELADGTDSKVVSTGFRIAKGLYNPQTTHGDIVVNQIRVSTFTSALQPAAAQAALLPIRAIYEKLRISAMRSKTGIKQEL